MKCSCGRDADRELLRRPVCQACYRQVFHIDKPPSNQFKESVGKHMLMEREIERQCSRFAPI